MDNHCTCSSARDIVTSYIHHKINSIDHQRSAALNFGPDYETWKTLIYKHNDNSPLAIIIEAVKKEVVKNKVIKFKKKGETAWDAKSRDGRRVHGRRVKLKRSYNAQLPICMM